MYIKASENREFLKNVVNKIFEVDIMNGSRKRNIVNARLVYAKILREHGQQLTAIGKSLNRDHTTVIHYLKNAETFMKHDSALNEKFIMARDVFYSENNFSLEYSTEEDLRGKIVELTDKLEKFELKEEYVILSEAKYKRLKNIINLIEGRVKKGQELIAEYKINQMLNDFYPE